MRIDVPWSTKTTPVEVAEMRVAGVLSANVGKAADPEGILRQALSVPGAEFGSFLERAASPLVVVVNDATRPTPSAEVLRVLRTDLEAWLAAGDRTLDFIVATGTHRAVLEEELDHIFGPGLAAAHAGRIHSHDAKEKDELVNMGRTARGTEILVNRLLADAGSVVVVNSVEPHYFAGYTGGRKSLFPGLAGYETVWANHKLSMQTGSELLVLEGNPVHEDLDGSLSVGIAGKQVYSIQLVLDEEHHVGFAAAGDLEKSWRQAIDVADRQFVLEIERRVRGRRGRRALTPWTATSTRPTRPSRAARSRSPTAGCSSWSRSVRSVSVRTRPSSTCSRHPIRPLTRFGEPTSRSTGSACSRRPASPASWSGRRSGRSLRCATKT